MCTHHVTSCRNMSQTYVRDMSFFIDDIHNVSSSVRKALHTTQDQRQPPKHNAACTNPTTPPSPRSTRSRPALQPAPHQRYNQVRVDDQKCKRRRTSPDIHGNAKSSAARGKSRSRHPWAETHGCSTLDPGMPWLTSSAKGGDNKSAKNI